MAMGPGPDQIALVAAEATVALNWYYCTVCGLAYSPLPDGGRCPEARFPKGGGARLRCGGRLDGVPLPDGIIEAVFRVGGGSAVVELIRSRLTIKV